MVVHDQPRLDLSVGIAKRPCHLNEELFELLDVGGLAHHELGTVQAVADGAEERHGLQVLLVDGGDDDALAGHPSATAGVRAPQLEGGLVHVDDALLPGLPALQLSGEPGPLLHQLGLLGLGDPGGLLGLLVADAVAGVDEGEGVGWHLDLVLLLDEPAAPLQGEEAHLVEDLVGD